ncbi:type I polyketide synthase [Rhizobium helianthi]|uniref:Type I polyketide synthase n=1 Tax=Rhizobium helianthi TaxID=1132695 RepID=A0ABW4M2X1_9HYPH
MNKIEQLSEALRSSLMANEDLKRLNRQLANASREPIAILSTSCRLPGGVTNADALWDLVESGGDAIGPLPLDRGWQLDALLQNRGETRNTPGMWQGGFLEDANAFDAAFFGISDREAMAMDPQHRLLLETTWEVIENAHILPGSLKKTSTGVFIGTTYQAYVPQIYDRAPELDGYRLQGGLSSMASGRVSYTFGLNGPSVTVDTACSSSLVAVHMAVQSLRAQECSLAIAGGATIVASPEVYVEFARQNGLAADGRCKAFSETADGTAFSEGVGMVLLARLSDALKLGYPILAVIRGSAINHDGASNGLTAPSGPAQEKVIARALKNAGLTTTDIDIVEAHGTGTALGDPIEANALINTYGQKRPPDRPLWLGSLKSNVGHVQAASGVVGLIKMVMALRHGIMPRTLHADLPSSKIEWSAGAVSLLNDARPWPDADRPRRAAVSSFGFSGTNSHVILEQAPEQRQDADAEGPDTQRASLPYMLPISATTSTALKTQAARMATYLTHSTQEDLATVCASMATGRTHFDHRAVCIGSAREELIAALEALAKADTASGLTQGVRAASTTSAFLFSGQGSQWAGMGRQLSQHLPAFTRHLDEIIAALDPHLPQGLADVIFAEAGSPQAALLDRTDFTQPALFAIEVALYRTLEELGVKPDYLCGHSIGEVAAAHIAGIFALADAARFVALRGRLMQDIESPGKMLAIEATEAQVLDTLAGLENQVSIAAINAPNSIVISGDTDVVLSLAEEWKKRGVRISQLKVSHAFHSPHIEAVVEELHRLAASLSLAAPTMPIVSTVTGALLTDEEARSPRYWARQARLPVRYADAVQFLHAQDVTAYVEVGPDAVLATLAQSSLATLRQKDGQQMHTLAVMRRNRNDARVFASALASLHVRGHTVDWAKLYTTTRRVDLPTYAFQRRRFWYKPKTLTPGGTGHDRTPTIHPFLHPGIELADRQGVIFSGRMNATAHAWMLDHAIEGVAINAGATTAELILAAGSTIGLSRLDSLVLLENLPLPHDGDVEIQLRISAPSDGAASVDVYFRALAAKDDDGYNDGESNWHRHATARLLSAEGAPSVWLDLAQWPPRQADLIEHQSLYGKLEEHGVHLGPAFQLITSAWRKGQDIYIEAEMPLSDEQAGEPSFLIHPALLDAGLQASLLQAAPIDGFRQLFSIGGLQVYRSKVERIRACVRLKSGQVPDNGHSEHSVRIADHAGVPVAEIASIVLRAADSGSRKANRLPVYRVEWPAISRSGEETDPATCWITPDGKPSGLLSGPPSDRIVSDMAEALRGLDAGAFACAALLCPQRVLENADDALEMTLAVVRAVQTWLAEPATQALPLFVVTQNAVDITGKGALLNLTQAPLWGLLRCVQWEHPQRIVLLDLEPGADPAAAVSLAWTAAQEGDVQLAVRNGQLLAARLAKHDLVQSLPMATASEAAQPGRGTGTALITGAGSLGTLVARHLAQTRHYERIVLASRRGAEAPGLVSLLELSSPDTEILVEQCDVADRNELERLLHRISTRSTLKAVIHTAGISEPVSFADLTIDAVTKVMRPKVDAAWALHDLTRDMQLDAFILFSSAVGVVGLKDQSHYGAANSFLDALAAYRRSLGLPATSLSWGMWDYSTEMGDQLGAERLASVISAGYRMISADYGLGVIAAALQPQQGAEQGLLLPARFDLRRLATASPSALLSNLLAHSSPRTKGQDFKTEYSSQDEGNRLAFLLQTVRDLACKVLRNPDPSSIGTDTEFRSLGFDSLTSIEIVAELSTLMGLSLPSTAVFDHSTPRSLATFLKQELEAKGLRKSSTESIADASEPPKQSAPESLGRMMLHAIEQGRSAEGRAILKGAAGFRPMFEAALPADGGPQPVWLNESGEAPLLICLNSFIPSLGDYTYRRLANTLAGRFDVAAISLPGYCADEALPARVEALGKTLAETVRECAGDRPFALAGFSTGGLAAYAAAEHLQAGPHKMQSLILIDTFHPRFMTDEAMQNALSEWVRTAGLLTAQDDAGLTAMAWYLDLFLNSWSPKSLKVPLCLIQARDGLTDVPPEDWAEPWGALASRVTVPGRHFTLLREDVAETAAKLAEMATAHGLRRAMKDAG